MRSSGRGLVRRTPYRQSIQIDLNDFGNLKALLPLADTDLDAGALWHAAVPCCLQVTDVYKCVGAAHHGHKSKALLSIEPFDDRFDRFLPPGKCSKWDNSAELRRLGRQTT